MIFIQKLKCKIFEHPTFFHFVILGLLKIVIWALKAKKWPCQAVLAIFQDMVKSLGKNLSFSSSLVNTGQHRKKLTYLGYYPTFSVKCDKQFPFSFKLKRHIDAVHEKKKD